MFNLRAEKPPISEWAMGLTAAKWYNCPFLQQAQVAVKKPLLKMRRYLEKRRHNQQAPFQI
jgi:hypothetical protein